MDIEIDVEIDIEIDVDVQKTPNKLEHGWRMIYACFPSSLLWGWRTVMFELSGFYSTGYKGSRSRVHIRGPW